ncbi:LLM class flavin-dependent oxidoreductase [Pseudonocardia acidicola]|uniref:LLM class flavin-dependent oxidoreductase n=1 Tax=Pseudonocardia acidicola TaxID=2724939 RepID=A0ABX1SDD6_9PSEU|nr:LLM class flavin-dependent oxidoreductase [Pseudonocardia acidicola]NMH99580.1 LLM class flavin-dependent oxidoreductase [Pseudonocardia acidicola]
MTAPSAPSPSRDAPAEHVPLSVLDLAPISSGHDAAEAIEATTRLARTVDALGYRRFWLAEHHNTDTFASSATALLIERVASATSRIRVGSGGIMLPNHAPLAVAEQFGTLATLHPGRIDLGLGRAPGTDQRTAHALRRGSAATESFPQDVRQLAAYMAPPGPGQGPVRAIPGQGTQVPLWMLGSSVSSAQLAARLGLPYAFASHFAPPQLMDALRIYRENFDPDGPLAQVDRPTVIAGVNVVVADDQQEAEAQFTTIQQMFLRIASGAPAPLDPPLPELRSMLDAQQAAAVDAPLGYSYVGTPDVVREGLEQFVDRTGADELLVVTYTHDPAVRRRSYELLAKAWGISGE